MLKFGKFPKKIYVREELKVVFSILEAGITTGITEDELKWVIVGSPGVGKSVLTVLLCFHLAKEHKQPVFLARQWKGEGGNPAGNVAICIYPGGKAVGYPGPTKKITNLVNV
jgi:hypothetical protein